MVAGPARRLKRRIGHNLPVMSRGFRRLSVVTVAVTYALIVIGGIVRVSGSGEGCGSADGASSWPLCRGGLVPPADLQTVIEFSHRIFATLSTVCILAVMVWALLRYRQIGRVVAWSVAAFVLLVVQILLGFIVIEFSLPSNVILVHLANAELVLACTAIVAMLAYTVGTDRTVAWKNPGAGSTLASRLAIATFVLVLSGAVVVDTGSSTGCNGWPLCGSSGGLGLGVASAGPDAINLLHRFIAGAVVLLIGASVPRIAKLHKDEPGMKKTMILVNVALLLQLAAGAAVVLSRVMPWTQGLHVALATALWLSIVVLTLRARIRVSGAGRADAAVTTETARAHEPATAAS